MAVVAFLDDPNESFANVEAHVQTDFIVSATSSNNAVTNSGVMWTTAGSNSAVRFAAGSSNGTITNDSTGLIRGGVAAVHFEGNGGTINNAGDMIGGEFGLLIVTPSAATVNNVFGGTIKGETGIWCAANDGTSQINNDGIVYGGNTGVTLFAGTLTNSGEVGGNARGVVSDTDGTATIVNTNFGGIWSSVTAIAVLGGEAVISNGVDCLITGVQAAIETGTSLASEGRISLTNFGKIDGDINCAAATGNVDDTIVNKGTINGEVFLGFGDDIFDGAGGTAVKVFGFEGNDTLTGGSAGDHLDGGAGLDALSGGAGNDTLVGGSDADKLDGGTGNDALYGGFGIDTIRGALGKDQLFGGADRDLFDFNSIKESVKGAKRDILGDFERGEDRIDLRDIDAKTGGGNQKFKFIGKQDFHDKKGELRYEDKGSKVIVQGDVNGDGKADFEIMVAVGSLSKGDFLL